MHKVFSSLVLVVGIMAAAPALANTYVCEVAYLPHGYSPAMGDYGYIQATYYSGAGCTGTSLGTYYYCSSGATSTTYCALPANCSGSDFRYSELGLHTLDRKLQHAAAVDQNVLNPTCGGFRGSYVEFRSN